MPPLSNDELLASLSESQRAFLKLLTDQRVANLATIIDLIGDMNADTLSIARALGDEDRKALRRFFWQVKPETLKFLTELREQELDELQAAVETYLAVKRTFRVMRWSAASLFAAFVAVMLLWEKLIGPFRAGAPK